MLVKPPFFGVWIARQPSVSWDTAHETAIGELGEAVNFILPSNDTLAVEEDVSEWCAERTHLKALITGGFDSTDIDFPLMIEDADIVAGGYRIAYGKLKTAWVKCQDYRHGVGGILLCYEQYRGSGGSAGHCPSELPSNAKSHGPSKYKSLQDLIDSMQVICPGQWAFVEGVPSYFRRAGGAISQTIFDALSPYENVCFIAKCFGWGDSGATADHVNAIEAEYQIVMDGFREKANRTWIALTQMYSDTSLHYAFPTNAAMMQDVVTAMAFGAIGAIGYKFDVSGESGITGMYTAGSPTWDTYYLRRAAAKRAFDRGSELYDLLKGAGYEFDYCYNSYNSSSLNNLPNGWGWIEKVQNNADKYGSAYLGRVNVSRWKKDSNTERYMIVGRDPTYDQRPNRVDLRFPCHYRVEETRIHGYGKTLTIGEIPQGNARVLTLSRGAFVDIRDGIPWNMPLSVDTYDGSDQITHPSVVFHDTGGYKFWISATPYPNAATYQSPCIYGSKDGYTWSVPSGVSNPLYALPAGGYNAYPDMFWNEDEEEFWLYYLEVGASTTVLRLCQSADGITWTRQTVWTPSETVYSPVVIKASSGTFYMFYVKTSGGHRRIFYRTSTDGTTWTGSDTAITTTYLPEPFEAYHLSIVAGSGKYYMLLSAYLDDGSVRSLYILRSTDLVTWQFRDTPILEPAEDMFRIQSIERTSGIIHGEQLIVWYGYKTTSNTWNIACAKLRPVESYFGLTGLVEEGDDY